MTLIRMVLLLLIMGLMGIFLLQNLSPTQALPLVLFGSKTIALPAPLWMLIFALAGAITGKILQGLRSVSVSGRRQGNNWVDQEEEEGAGGSGSFRRQSSRSQKDSFGSDGKNNWRQGEDEPEDEEEEWNIEEPPRRDKPVKEATPPPPEEKNSPGSNSNSNSTYAYKPREEKNSGVGRADTVYDAQYRVLRDADPPQDEDKEDWGFEDDPDFR